MAVLSYGVSVEVRVSDPALLPLVVDILPPSWEVCSPGRADLVYSLVVEPEKVGSNASVLCSAFVGSTRIVQNVDVDTALRVVESSLQLGVAELAKDRVFVHAGVVEWKGRAIVLPGRSMAGKTTLVSRLIEAGCTYYSDEYAVLDSDGMVHPYSRSLSVRQDDGSLPSRKPPEAFGGRSGLKAVPAGVILLTRYSPGVRFRARRVSQGMAVLGLMDNTVPVRRDPERTIHALVKLASAPCWKGARGDAAEAVKFVLGAAQHG